jgi:para-aminobenzoate synthetase
VTVIGSSPERFLQWDRRGHLQFRPIKGTVKKGPGVNQTDAHAILNSSKERAENLMIVDLIGHDLGGVVGAANCYVSQLMVIEEYETVYQLVSAIEGQLSNDKSGMDVLRV